MTHARRQMLTTDEIKDLLFAQRDAVARHYAPAVSGSYIDKGGYWTLNPGRPDKSVGSFVVWVEGPKAGRWNDFATGQRGDLLDLIALSQHCDLKTAFREARGFLGLQDDSPEDIARRKRQADRVCRARCRRRCSMTTRPAGGAAHEAAQTPAPGQLLWTRHFIPAPMKQSGGL